MADWQKERLNDIYNLILRPGTREWERGRLVSAKNVLETTGDFKAGLAKLEAELRPLALRNNLTPDVADFYAMLIEESTLESYDFEKHFHEDFAHKERAVFAGGCFWCMVEPFEEMNGIVSVLSGYTGGHVEKPTYDQVSSQTTGHVEAVEIIFDTRVIHYEELLWLYWQITDPTDAFGQFQDRGDQYRPIIFVQNEEQKKLAEKTKQQLIASKRHNKPIVTEIKPLEVFWPAENYHQQFYRKQPKRYRKIKKTRQQLLNYQHMTEKIRTITGKKKEN